MPKASLAQMKAFGGSSLAGIPDEQLQMFLDDAAGSVIAGGVGESHPRFAELQRYYAMHLMDIAGIISNPVSGGVDGIQFAYSQGGGSTPTTWQDLYKKKRREVIGMAGRIS